MPRVALGPVRLKIKWWRRRESNPRPETIHSGVYIHSPTKDFHPLELAGHGVQGINLC